MNRKNSDLVLIALALLFFLNDSVTTAQENSDSRRQPADRPIRVGIIGLDTSHSVAFTKLLNSENDSEYLRRCRVTCAFPKGSADIESSVSRIPGYTEEIRTMGVDIVQSIDELVSRVDAVLLETNDGRPHLKQVLPVLRANKPVFVDKPMAGSLADVIAIFRAAEHFDTPVFSSSSLRFVEAAQLARKGELAGEVFGCDTFSPAKLEPTHPDLFWYGIHGVEQLFTVMGPGCGQVTRTSTENTDVVVGVWRDGRLGTFRGTRTGPHGYGGTVFGADGQKSSGGSEGYRGLMEAIARFFATGEVPVDESETIEIYAFMEAADASKTGGGVPVKLAPIIDQAEAQAARELRVLLDEN